MSGACGFYREIIAVCSQIHTKHTNTLCGQNVELLNVKLVVYIVTTWIFFLTYSIPCIMIQLLHCKPTACTLLDTITMMFQNTQTVTCFAPHWPIVRKCSYYLFIYLLPAIAQAPGGSSRLNIWNEQKRLQGFGDETLIKYTTRRTQSQMGG